jgi:hypothetical protein
VSCPFYTKVRGKHYCGVKACHTRKTNAWNIHLMEQASQQLGIFVYTENDGAYRALGYEHDNLFNKKDKDLRLMPAIADRRVYQNFKGVEDHVFFVVATGAAIAKMGSRGSSVNKVSGGKMTDKEKGERRAMKIYRMRRLELFWAYTAVAKTMFEAAPAEVLTKLCNWHNIMIDDRIPEEYSKGNSNPAQKVEYQRRALVWRLIMECGSHYKRESMVTILAKMQKLTGIAYGKALGKQAEQWDAEINAAAQPVSTATGKKG